WYRSASRAPRRPAGHGAATRIGVPVQPMCYSPQIYAEFKRFQREFGAVMDIETYVATFWPGETKQPRAKAPRALIRELEEIAPPELRAALLAQDQADMAALEEELFALRRRVGDAQRALQVKVTKKAQEDVR